MYSVPRYSHPPWAPKYASPVSPPPPHHTPAPLVERLTMPISTVVTAKAGRAVPHLVGQLAQDLVAPCDPLQGGALRPAQSGGWRQAGRAQRRERSCSLRAPHTQMNMDQKWSEI